MASTVNETIETRLFINDEFRESSSSKTFEVVYPYTKEVVAQVQEADIQDVEDAVSAANAAFPAWRDLGTEKRGAYLGKLSQLILESNNELAKLETLSTGRPISQFFDASFAAQFFGYFAGGGWTVQGTASLNTPDHLNLTVKQPYGVVALIIPWNFPLIMFASKMASALAAGNTVVLKSSEKAPLTSLYVAKLIKKAGFPSGVVNIISGFGNPTGAALASHMTVRCISFTGSSATGQKIQAAAAKSNMKHVHMELGGKSPAIIFEDADLETAVAQTQFSIQFNSGQVCSANSRIYVHEPVAKQFTELFREKFAAVRMGDPLDPATSHGPQIDVLQYNRIKGYLDIGEKDGTLSLGGDANDGFFVRPTIFEGVAEDSRLMQEEVFGPVVAINTFSTETEAIEKANNSEFGLYAAVFTKDIDRAVRLAKALDAGTVGVNCTSPTNALDTAFGGLKMSGNGREGLLYSLDSFLETKSILIKTARL
ncbi:Aldehyde/histidinol dehydrogenase [Penicillium robsamsonii]|uniref:Aldehyde/histidinol dehydrogenase n=1 Tax=Penicillium robsamsonii TaxID=1792511 RepID=UPI0025478ED2|nr:Aldehyde/histidinol dehydrogenase [Penicillium robsamsonii]KAJ5834857.1 Aldehyde/histidinol dehydrogenase [Penicillium robsamsonii]